MADPKELPQLVTELLDMSKEYLRQETVEPAKKLGRFAGFALAAGFVFGVAALFGGLAAYALYRELLPEGEWWLVLARGLTLLTTGAVAGLIGWRLTKT
jgi:hypothetical protein